MIVVTNRLSVDPARRAEFEEKFRARSRSVEGASGFLKMEILRPVERMQDPESKKWSTTGAGDRDASVSTSVMRAPPSRYEVRSYWESLAHFDAWKESDAFREAHRQVLDEKGQANVGRMPPGLVMGRPEIRFHEVIE